MEISFCELRAKEVVNLFDGKQLGHIIDIIIDTSCSRIVGIVVPCEKNFLSFFKPTSNLFIPYHRICKIGKDVILVDINIATQQNVRILENQNKTPKTSENVNENPYINNPKENFDNPQTNNLNNNIYDY